MRTPSSIASCPLEGRASLFEKRWTKESMVLSYVHNSHNITMIRQQNAQLEVSMMNEAVNEPLKKEVPQKIEVRGAH